MAYYGTYLRCFLPENFGSSSTPNALNQEGSLPQSQNSFQAFSGSGYTLHESVLRSSPIVELKEVNEEESIRRREKLAAAASRRFYNNQTQ